MRARATGNARLPQRRALVIQLAILFGSIAAWQWVPEIPGLKDLSVVFDRTFVSSPANVWRALVVLATGDGVQAIWVPIFATVRNALMGAGTGMLIGITLGLALSNDERLSQVFRPIVVATNSVPRIALIPLIVILFGPNERATMFAAGLTGFFNTFFNAYEGGRTVSAQIIDNAQIMGASPFQLMRHIRFPFVLAWSFASLPNTVSHGLLATVTAEVFTGATGVGRILTAALVTSAEATVYALVIYVATVGLVLVALSDRIQKRVLHWFVEGRS